MSYVRPCRLLYTSITAPTRWCARDFSSTRYVRQTGELDEGDNVEDIIPSATADDAPAAGIAMKYDEWIATEGQKWKHPDPLGPKWLGGNVPFPLNPTFRPPIPVSDALRTTIYSAFATNPKENDIRTLSSRYGVSIKRVEAIIRLKELEERWKKSKPIQTGFLKGMERLLGLNVGGRMTSVPEEVKSESHREVATSDEVSQQTTEEGQDTKRGISMAFFEPVDEGQEPLVSRLLDEEQLKARASQAHRMSYPTTIVQPDPSKPAYKFVDVGLRWVNRADVERRAKESARRKAVKHSRKKTVEVGQGEPMVATVDQ